MYDRLSKSLALVAALSLGACLADPSDAENDHATAERPQALGEPQGDYPSHGERVVLYLTNRARTAPATFNPQEPYPPSPPLMFDLGLAKAARWQARHIIEGSCWCEDHSSCCTVRKAADGTVSCADAPRTCGATSAEARISLFSSHYSGENAAMGYAQPEGAVDGWIHSSGHWANINHGGHNLLGAGQHARGWVQVFGRNPGPTPVIGDGIHWSQGPVTGFGITYYQPESGGPRTALVIVDGQCHPLQLSYGSAEHGAFETMLDLGPGCHRYYFHFTDGQGQDHTYPTQGSLGTSVDEPAGCPLFLGTRPADTCSPSGQSCTTGETRYCYTGPWGTQDRGICRAGVERCIGAQWTGQCRDEVLPDATEHCENTLDDDCDGQVDEGCPEATSTNPQIPPGERASQTTSSDAGGCRQTTAPRPPDGALGLAALALLAWRKRQVKARTESRISS